MIAFKLALRNVRKSFKDYGVYFLTLTFGVCIFYVFNSIESQQAMMAITSSLHESLKLLSRFMGYASVFVSFILGFLILYANNFLIKRRKKELGIYQTLGMGKPQISKILIIETAFVGIFSLIVGLIIGIFLSQAFAVITASMFEVKLKEFVFIFSFSAMLKTIVYFGIAFIFVMIFNTLSIGNQKLIDLIYADRKSEKFKTPHLILSVIIFILSVICLAIAYYIALKNGIAVINTKFWVSIIMGIIGTFLFFFSLSGFFLKVIKQSKSVYLKNLNIFILRQINNKINTNYLSMAVVCLMIFISICTISFGTGMSKALTTNAEKSTPFDLTFSFTLIDNDDQYINFDLKNEYKKAGVNLNDFAKEVMEFDFYSSAIDLSSNTITTDFIKLSDYNRVLGAQGIAPINLDKNQFVINYTGDSSEMDLIDNKATFKGIEVYNKGILSNNIINLPSKDIFIVMPDELLINEIKARNILVINYIEASAKYNDIAKKTILNVDLRRDGYSSARSLQSKIDIFENNKSFSTTTAYLAMYFGIVFLITSAAVLAISQLSEASDNVKRYNLLRKIGTENRMINKALFTQTAIYFTVPMILATVHSIIGIQVGSYILKVLGDLNILRDCFIAAGFIIFIYGGYFLATYFSSKSIINKS